jgi:hypothetical protein
MPAAIQVLSSIISTINMLFEFSALGLAAGYADPACLMHAQGEPRSMRRDRR